MTDLADRLRATVDLVAPVSVDEIETTVHARRIRQRRVAVASVAAAFAVGLVLIAILVPKGGPSKVKVQTTGPATSRPANRSTVTCRTAQLVAKAERAGGAGGNYLYQVSLQNISTDPCRLDGFATMTGIDASRQPAQIVRSYSLTPGKSTYILFDPPVAKPITLGSEQLAYFDFSYSDNPVSNQPACPAVDRLVVRPPGDETSVTVTLDQPLESVCSTFAVAALENHPYA